MRVTALLAAVAAAPLAGAALAPTGLLPCALVRPAMAQANPSANDIVNQLRPNGPMTGRTRGIGNVRAPAGEPGDPAQAARSRPANAGTAAGRPSSTPPAAAQRAAQAGQVAAPSVNLTVQFATGSAELTPAAVRTLDELGQALSSQALSSYRFQIEGHTDATGSREHNQVLSKQRADKVVEYLSTKFNLDRGKLEAVGFGQDRPLVPGTANVPQPRNRRVTVVNLGT